MFAAYAVFATCAALLGTEPNWGVYGSCAVKIVGGDASGIDAVASRNRFRSLGQVSSDNN